MTSRIDSIQPNLFQSSFWGTLRGILVDTLIYPLEVVKIRQQCSKDSEKSIRIAKRLFQEEGYRGFYKGLYPQLLKTSLKQIWCWPMITGMPYFLRSYGLRDTNQQILTGLSIAIVDAAITTPLERAKIFSALTGKTPFSLANVYKDGWQGFTVYWAKRSINMVTFLTAQEYLRNHSRGKLEKLRLSELTRIGVEVAVIVSLVSAPFDIANTLKQAQNLYPSHLFLEKRFFRLYRGWPINALSLVIHNVASVILIEKLRKD